jgi:hypothetical protein
LQNFFSFRHFASNPLSVEFEAIVAENAMFVNEAQIAY